MDAVKREYVSVVNWKDVMNQRQIVEQDSESPTMIAQAVSC